MVEHDGRLFRTSHRKSEVIPLEGPNRQGALAGIERRNTLRIRKIVSYGVEFGIIVYLIQHPCALDRTVLAVQDGDPVGARRDIAVNDVDFSPARLARDDVLGPVIVAKHLGMQQHSS